jgi:hypothetical protein
MTYDRILARKLAEINQALGWWVPAASPNDMWVYRVDNKNKVAELVTHWHNYTPSQILEWWMQAKAVAAVSSNVQDKIAEWFPYDYL